jgi:hypothetical protein
MFNLVFILSILNLIIYLVLENASPNCDGSDFYTKTYKNYKLVV